ncbi:T9SS type A sorting domain-containing protein [bacterium]|nr:T9SS type A sorting domain-containing protein [bacterium]
MLKPLPIWGVACIDVNQDQTYELIVALQDQPLKSLDAESMEVIMTSDFVVPDIPSSIFEIGRFDSTGNIQLLIVNEQARLQVYNFPEEWSIPELRFESSDIYIPDEFKLLSAYPNPFNISTNIDYKLHKNEHIKVTIYNMNGHLVDILVNDLRPAGYHSVAFSALNLPSGQYFCRMEAGGTSQIKKLTLLR